MGAMLEGLGVDDWVRLVTTEGLISELGGSELELLGRASGT